MTNTEDIDKLIDHEEINEQTEDLYDDVETWRQYFQDKKKQRDLNYIHFSKPPLVGQERKLYIKYKKMELTKKLIIEKIGDNFQQIQSLFWDEIKTVLYFIDEIKKIIIKYVPKKESFKYGKIEGNFGPSFVLPIYNKNDEYILGMGYHIYKIEWHSKQTKCSSVYLIKEQEKIGNLIQFGKADPIGRLIIGSIKQEKYEAEIIPGYLKIYETPKKFTLIQNIDDTSWTDVAWTWDTSRIFLIDPHESAVVTFHYDIHEGILGERISDLYWSELMLEGQPRCLTCDVDNNLWIGCSGIGKIIQLNPVTETILKTISIESCTEITSLVFGDKYRDTLYVATTNKTDQEEDDPKIKDSFKGSSFLYRIKNIQSRNIADYRCRWFE